MLAFSASTEKFRRAASVLLTALGLAAILWATLRNGDPAAFQGVPVTCLVCGRNGGIDVWRNVVLFMPLGVGLGLLGVRPSRAAALGLALSFGVETMQFTVLVGRTATVSDLVTNTAGTALGVLLVRRWRDWALPGAARARWLAAAAAALWLAALALTGAGLRWSDATPPFRVNQLPPTDGSLRAFEGVVHEATMDGGRVTPGWRDAPVAPRAAADTLRLGARVTPSYEPGMLRPLVWLHTPSWAEVLIFGQRGRTLVVRLRTASADARFSSPSFILHDAIPGDRSPVALSAAVTHDAVRLRSASAEGVREVRIGKELSLGWMLLVPPNGVAHRWPAALVSAAWLAALLMPLAYWGARARARARARSLSTLALVVAFAAGSAVLATHLFDLAPLTAGGWAGMAAGVAAGWGVGVL
ncbi:MAG TPA: VanZ family protein, partial [Gemmatimonadaceae bacterium]|nr:VanZ family protein [Gemmatimonadaceae bacterium]